jgi:hypothetical protein
MQSQTAPSDQHGIMPHANIWHLRRFLTGTSDQKYCDDKAKNLTHPGVHAPLLSSSSSALLVVWFFVLCLILPVFRLVRRTSLARLSVIGPPSVITAVKRIARAAARQSLAAFRSLRALGSSTGATAGAAAFFDDMAGLVACSAGSGGWACPLVVRHTHNTSSSAYLSCRS